MYKHNKRIKECSSFGGERLTLYVDKNLKCDHCGCEINHQYDHNHSIAWTSNPEMKLIKQKINKISKQSVHTVCWTEEMSLSFYLVRI